MLLLVIAGIVAAVVIHLGSSDPDPVEEGADLSWVQVGQHNFWGCRGRHSRLVDSNLSRQQHLGSWSSRYRCC